MPKGDIVLVSFPFTDLSDNKIRPSLVLIEAEYDITVSFITTQTGWNDEVSVMITATSENGLKKDSLIRLNKLATIDKELVKGKIGALNKQEITIVNQKLKDILLL